MTNHVLHQHHVLALVLLLVAFLASGCGVERLPAVTGLPTTSAVSTSIPPVTLPETATLAPSATPSPTPRPYRIVVEDAVYSAWEAFWVGLAADFPGAQVLRAESLSDGGLYDGRIVETWHPASGANPLRAEPYVWVSHHEAQVTALDWDELAALAQDGWHFWATQAGLSLVAERLPNAACTAVTSPGDAISMAARDRRTLALVPWEAVDVRVRALPFEGARLAPEPLGEWQLQRCLVLEASTPPPEALTESLADLAYEPPAVVKLVAVGDIMLARNVGERIQREGDTYTFAAPGVAELLQHADVTFGNLECAVSARGQRRSKAYTFRADPAVLEGLVWAGFDVLSLANNHTCDYGPDALCDTVALVEQAGMLAVGAGDDVDRACEAQFVERQGLKLAFLAYNQIGPRWMDAGDSSPGSAYADPERMVADVAAAAALSDVVIVSCHWGVEHASHATAFQRELTRRLWDAGAALVLGHHPHVMQGLAVEEGRCAVYSMGNFCFDMGTPGSRDGFALRCLMDASGVKQIELVPYHIEGYRPCLLDERQTQVVVARIHRLTSQAGGWPK